MSRFTREEKDCLVGFISRHITRPTQKILSSLVRKGALKVKRYGSKTQKRNCYSLTDTGFSVGHNHFDKINKNNYKSEWYFSFRKHKMRNQKPYSKIRYGFDMYGYRDYENDRD